MKMKSVREKRDERKEKVPFILQFFLIQKHYVDPSLLCNFLAFMNGMMLIIISAASLMILCNLLCDGDLFLPRALFLFSLP